MDLINPLAGSYMQTPAIQRQQSIEKQRQLRRRQSLDENVAAEDDQLEHQVESSEEVVPIHDEQPHQEERKPRDHSKSPLPPEDEEKPHLDMTA